MNVDMSSGKTKGQDENDRRKREGEKNECRRISSSSSFVDEQHIRPRRPFV